MNKHKITIEQVVDLLNEQDKTISEQAIQLDYLKNENQHMKQVLDENKQLKERIKELEKKSQEEYTFHNLKDDILQKLDKYERW